jgi:urea-proton symporter
MSTNTNPEFDAFLPPFEKYKGQESYFGGEPPLSQAIGYLVVLGFGVFFSIMTTCVVFLNKHFGNMGDQTSEHFKYVTIPLYLTFYCFVVVI